MTSAFWNSFQENANIGFHLLACLFLGVFRIPALIDVAPTVTGFRNMKARVRTKQNKTREWVHTKKGRKTKGNHFVAFSVNYLLKLVHDFLVYENQSTSGIRPWRTGSSGIRNGTTKIGYGTTNTDAGVGIGLKRRDSKI